MFLKAKAKFKVPADTEYLWLLVMGAPTEHWTNPGGRGAAADVKHAQWPYEFKLTGTKPDDAIVKI